MITIRERGDFKNLTNFFERVKSKVHLSKLDKYARRGVDALSVATPKDTAETSQKWRYKIRNTKSGASIDFYNDSINDGVNVAVILQYGHATKNGGWVEGVDYINPALRPIFKDILDHCLDELK